MDTHVLIDVGLTQREAEAYIALLQLQEAVVAAIAQKTRENRTHLYDTLRSLMHKGLASFVIKNGRKYFRAASPEKLVEYLEEKKEVLNDALPQLRELARPQIQTPLVEVYEGDEGIRTILREMLRENKELLCLGSTGRSPEILPFFLEHFHKQRQKQKLPLRVLYNNDVLGRKRGEEVNKQKRACVKYLEKTSPTTTYIYGDNVVTIVWIKDKLVATKIKDSDVADSFRSYFELLWKQAKTN